MRIFSEVILTLLTDSRYYYSSFSVYLKESPTYSAIDTDLSAERVDSSRSDLTSSITPLSTIVDRF